MANLRRQQPPELFRQFPRDDFSADRPNGSVTPELSDARNAAGGLLRSEQSA
jgi:hypothetical protein